jgi:type IV secretory pathway VirB10-like protein
VNEPIQEKALKPSGLVPKNVQSWLLISLALLMVVIMWATGGKKPQPAIKTAATTVPAQAPPEVNQTRINDLQNRIEELQRQELVAQNALAQQGRLLGAMPQGSQPGQQPSASGNQPPERAEDAIQSEQKRRQYLSLFASNVALSYRKSPAPAQPATEAEPGSNHTMETPLPESPDTTQLAQLLKEMQPIAPPQTTAPPTARSISVPAQNVSPERNSDRKEEALRPAAAPSGTHNAAAGQTYILFEGTILETVLINRLDGSFSGPVDCLLTNDVYSHDRQHLLIPAGTKVLGEAKKVEALGQTRLAVVFHRLIMPDGYSVSLDQFKGLDQIGDTGLRDKVNNHYLRIFGASLAIGALGAVSEAGTGGVLTASGSDLMRQGFAQSTAQSSEQILDRFLNILPTVTIREGHRIKVYLSGDLALPDYNNHKIPSDF